MPDFKEVVNIQYVSNLASLYEQDIARLKQLGQQASQAISVGGGSSSAGLGISSSSTSQVRETERLVDSLRAKFAQAGTGAQQMAQGVNNAGRAASSAGGGFASFALRVAEGMAVAYAFSAALQFVGGVLQSVKDRILEVSRATAQLGMLTKGDRGDVASAVVSQGIEGAKYGINFEDVTRGEVMRGRRDMSEDDAIAARKTAAIWEVEYTEALEEVYQTRQKLNNEGIKGFQIDNMMATLWEKTGASFEKSSDSIQRAINIYRSLNLTVEQTALIIAKTSDSLEIGGDEAGKNIQRTVDQLQKQREELAKFGISGETNKDLLLSAYKVTRQLVDKGDTEQLSALQRAVSKGLMGGGTEFATQWVNNITAIGGALENTNTELSSADALIAEKMNSIDQRSQQVKASWDNLTASVVAFGEKAGVIQTVSDLLYGMSIQINALAESINGLDIGENIKGIQNEVGNMIKNDPEMAKMMVTNANAAMRSIPVVGPWMEMLTSSYFAGSYARQNASQGKPSLSSSPSMRSGGMGTGGEEEMRAIESFMELPAGSNMQQFQSLYAKYQSQLSSAGFADESKKGVAFRDQLGRIVSGPSDYDSEASKMAMDELKRQMQYSLLELPEGMSGDQFKGKVQAEEAKLSQIDAYKNTREFNVKTYYFYDNAMKRWDSIQATQDEISAATKDINKEMKAVRGVFNLPADALGQIRVTLSALSNDIVRVSDMGKGYTGGASTELSSRAGAGSGGDDFEFWLRYQNQANMRTRGHSYAKEESAAGKPGKDAMKERPSITNKINVYIDGKLIQQEVSSRQEKEISSKRKASKGSNVAS